MEGSLGIEVDAGAAGVDRQRQVCGEVRGAECDGIEFGGGCGCGGAVGEMLVRGSFNVVCDLR